MFDENGLNLSEKSKCLFELLSSIPPQFEAAKDCLDTHQLSADEITRVGNLYADKCLWDYDDYLYENLPDNCALRDLPFPTGVTQGIPSAYIYDVVDLLLQYGLDPNAVYEVDGYTYNIMQLILYIDNEYVAADTMRLLLDHGGNPNLQTDTETVFERIVFEIWFGAVEQEARWRYDSWIHIWMVLLAYGGEIPEKKPIVETYREYENYRTDNKFDLKKLRNHRNYYYGILRSEKDITISIFDKKTLWEVVRA